MNKNGGQGWKGTNRETAFNVGLDKQFIPFWNGLMHLIGVIKNHVITMRYDWYNIISECETFEKEYLNTSGFCESCVFYQMPSYLNEVLDKAAQDGLTDCKEIAKDNDIIYTFCIERKRTRRWLRFIIFIMLFFVFVVVFLTWYNHRNSTASIPKLNSVSLTSKSIPNG